MEVDGAGQGFKKLVNYYLHGLGIGFVILVTGNARSKIGNGKTVTALKLAEIIEPGFDISRFTFTPYEFLTQLNKIRENRDYYKVLILDEGEIAASSKEWYTLGSKALAAAMMTFRNTRTVIIIVTPMASLINSQVRKLCAIRVVPSLTIEHNKKVVHAKFYRVSTDFEGDKTYYRKLKFWDSESKRVWCPKYVKVGLPSKHLLDAYEKVDWDYKVKINTNPKLLNDLNKLDETDVESGNKMDKTILELVQHPDVLKEINEKGKVSATTIKGIKRNLGIQTCGSIAKAINKEIQKEKEAISKVV